MTAKPTVVIARTGIKPRRMSAPAFRSCYRKAGNRGEAALGPEPHMRQVITAALAHRTAHG
jgi:hypothetical protein